MSRILYSPSRSANALRGREVADVAPADGDAIRWDAGDEAWKPAPVGGGGGAGGSPPHMPYAWQGGANSWYTPMLYIQDRSWVGANLFAVPYWSGAGGTITRMGVNPVGTTVDRLVVMGIYDHNSALRRPGNLLAEKELHMQAAGDQVATISANLAPATLYWLALHTAGTITLRSGGMKQGHYVLGAVGVTQGAWLGLRRSETYTGSLPSVFGSATAESDRMPMIAVAY